MIAPDANLLIYSYNPDAPEHRQSRAWFEAILSGTELVGLPIFSLLAFLRFVTHANHLKAPVSFPNAMATVDTWLALPNVRILYPGDEHWTHLQQLGQQVRLRGAQLTDAAIAAIALEYGAVIHTNDRDFARFPGVRWHNPLQP